jgi:hypothetical protein
MDQKEAYGVADPPCYLFAPEADLPISLQTAVQSCQHGTRFHVLTADGTLCELLLGIGSEQVQFGQELTAEDEDGQSGH